MSQEAQTDPFIEGIHALTARTARCIFGTWLDTLTPERRAAIDEALAAPPKRVPSTKISTFAQGHGYKGAVDPVQRHRGERCRCAR